ncbi:MAG: glucose 1-dehydrogenase [Phycisphaerales bacterium]|nr:glucose 1-dehydrogenase [Phycisphaerales bacterium]
MRAVAVFPGTKEVGLIDVPEPVIERPTDVKLRMLEVGVCGTDREICGFHYGFPPEGQDHLVIGHEALGEVVGVGSGVTGFKVGDLAVLTVRRPCGEADCASCRVGRQDFCYSGRFTERGIKNRHGFMTEMVVDDEAYLIPVPKHLRDVAVMVEPLTIAEKALIEVWQIQKRLPWECPHAGHGGAPGDRFEAGVCHHALVLGAGPIGLLGAMAFRAAGFSTFVYSLEPAGSEKARLVESFESTYISAKDTPIDRLMDRIGTIDVVYEATGASRLSFEVLAQCGPNAAFVFSGVPGLRGPVEVNTDLLMRRMVLNNQVLLGTVNAGRDAFEAAIRDLEVFKKRWPDALRALRTGEFPIEQYREPLLGAAGIKNVITFG